MNAAAALIAGDKTVSFKEGIALANAAIDSGNSLQKLEEFIVFSHNPV
jgi:anthranilate phosphoribosyltransferase